MELRDVLNQMMQENLRASQPANLCIGTVTAADPLEITISTGMGPLKKPILYLTSAVIEKKIPVLKHKHTTKGFRHSHTVDGLSHTHSGEEGETGPALDGAYPTGEGLEQDAFISDEQLKEIILNVERFRWQIYRPYSGMQWRGLIGQDPGYVTAELQRRLREALTMDDRVKGISQFDYILDGDALACSVTVDTV